MVDDETTPVRAGLQGTTHGRQLDGSGRGRALAKQEGVRHTSEILLVLCICCTRNTKTLTAPELSFRTKPFSLDSNLSRTSL